MTLEQDWNFCRRRFIWFRSSFTIKHFFSWIIYYFFMSRLIEPTLV